MARIFIDGFEAGDTKLWENGSGQTVVTSIADMDGTYCLELAGSSDYVKKSLANPGEIYIAFLYRPIDNTNSLGIIQFDADGLYYHGGVRRTASGGPLKWYEGGGANPTLRATGTINILANTTYLIELRIKPRNSGGIVQIKVNGTLDIDYSGDTASVKEYVSAIQLGWTGYSTTTSYAYFDNVVIDDASWIGSTKIQAVVPTGAGNSTQWTPSAGANYQCVDEKPPSETDYNSTNTTGHLDQFAAGNLSGSIESIKCVQVQALAKKEGTPTPTNIQLSLRTGGSDFVSSNKLLTTTSKQFSYIWEANPDTTNPWEVSEVNAVEIGTKAVA